MEKRRGPSSWGRVVSLANLSAKAYSPVAEYPDSEAAALISAASQLAGKPFGEFLEEFGEALAPELLAMHPGLVQPEWKTLDVIMNAEEIIHAVVRRRNPAAKPPVLRCARYSDDEVQLVYASPRKLCQIAKGIIRGVARHYQEEVSINDHSCMNDGDPFCAIQIKLLTADARTVGVTGPVEPREATAGTDTATPRASESLTKLTDGAERTSLDGVTVVAEGAPIAVSGAGERRHLTVLFCDLVGSTEIAARLDPEEWREMVAGYHRAAAEAITRFGGHVAKYLGDGVMAYFGWPEAHDNDGERAARAGLAILEAILEAQP